MICIYKYRLLQKINITIVPVDNNTVQPSKPEKNNLIKINYKLPMTWLQKHWTGMLQADHKQKNYSAMVTIWLQMHVNYTQLPLW